MALSFARRGGLAVVFDLERHADNDLGKKAIVPDIDSLVDTCDVLGVDLPCSTWSRARRAPRSSPFPSAVRTNEKLMGLPDNPPRDAAMVRKHNFMYRQALKWIRHHADRNGTGYLENPLTSMLWRTRGVRRLMKRRDFAVVDFDMCQYNCGWRKPTRLLVWGELAGRLQLKRCQGKRGVCSRTHRAHITLSGVADGHFRTSAAQIYPKAFTDALADCIFGVGKNRCP